MKERYTAVIKHSGDWWIGWIEEVPGVNCQEGTREELLETLRTTLREALDLNRKEALEAAGPGYEEESIAI
ncbi:MAG: type II toxin-antitoxin system HicB family antitoxin [Gammaproteobacteria bacterium]